MKIERDRSCAKVIGLEERFISFPWLAVYFCEYFSSLLVCWIYFSLEHDVKNETEQQIYLKKFVTIGQLIVRKRLMGNSRNFLWWSFDELFFFLFVLRGLEREEFCSDILLAHSPRHETFFCDLFWLLLSEKIFIEWICHFFSEKKLLIALKKWKECSCWNVGISFFSNE